MKNENLNEKFENLEVEFDLENCGASGFHYEYTWQSDANGKAEVYVKTDDNGDIIDLIVE